MVTDHGAGQGDWTLREFEGQVAVVTGGAAGIGAAIVRALAAGGATVAIVDLADVGADQCAHLAGDSGARIGAWRCDVTRSSEVEAACAAIREEMGPPGILVNNVGGSGNVRAVEVEETTDELWEAILSRNLGSTLRFCRALVPAMREKRFGRIVNITSSLWTGMFGTPGTVGARLPYVTAKAGLVGMTKQLAKDLAPHGILVNAVAPGFTLPDENSRITQRFRALPPEEQRPLVANIPIGRPATGEDMARAVCFLASPRNAYVAGQVLAVDGG